MITFFDLLQQPDFRNSVYTHLADSFDTPYLFPEKLPPLYQYKPLSKYAVDDICSGKITATSIGEFNDLFDGALHRYGNKQERTAAAENKWSQLKSLCAAANAGDIGLDHDYYVGLYKNHYKIDSRLKFRMLDYLGTYVSCFTTRNNVVLMWAHYARSNTGICVEYDFNKLPENHILTKSIFPVRYSDVPVDLSDLLDDNYTGNCKNLLEAAVLCSALNKSSVWSYEDEWRLVWVLASEMDSMRRIPLKTGIIPSRICFGYHFLRPLFYYSEADYKDAKSNMEQLLRLLDFIDKHNIPISIMMPVIGQYTLESYSLEAKKITQFITQCFDDQEPEDIRYYHTVHDELKDLLDDDTTSD